MRVLAVVGVLAVAACSSETTGETGGCADITGNWKLSSTRTDGTCTDQGLGSSDSAITIRKGASGHEILFPGLVGACPATLDTSSCKLVANCAINAQDGGALLGSVGIEWTFSGANFSGSEVGHLNPPVVARSCTANYTDKGTKL